MSARVSNRKGTPMPCIFVHAGAGYHSKENEASHLRACEDACKAAMAVLKTGGSAVDAVEMAVKVLEDREITNAGYGSNPNIDGVVECDAIVVDHMGRSGAAGAVAQIKNPVSLARVLLDCTSKPLSLRRVPPNLLVGQGATDFAYEQGLPVVPHGYLVSPMARHRWQKWRAELMRAEWKSERGRSVSYTDDDLDALFKDMGNSETYRQAHQKMMLASLRDSQTLAAPISPSPSDPTDPGSHRREHSPTSILGFDSCEPPATSLSDTDEGYTDPVGPPGMHDRTARRQFPTAGHALASPISLSSDPAFDGIVKKDNNVEIVQQDGLVGRESLVSVQAVPTSTENTASPTETMKNLFGRSDMDDRITDTIGAIAIDHLGNIACAASSGGIGMKHRGRVGPAALVGIGASVIPIDPSDEEQTSIATVVSGTGEHMATTMAATVCSHRIYNNHRRLSYSRGSTVYEECTEDEALRSFITDDFLGHPSVRNSETSAAIGTLTIKKTTEGVQLYFGHTTDSFALASMHVDDARPACTMSRVPENGKTGVRVMQGGRMIRWRRRRGR